MNNDDMDQVNHYFQKWYEAKEEDFKKRTSFERYREKGCEAYAEVHDDVLVFIAHALKSFP